MSFIHVLDDNTINKIAAGEVVERPASVIKELVENAIDAKADRIEVEIAAGGTSFMRVTDNGIGMSREDAEKAILRHATSKIVSVEDLQSIGTLGFRGEALPSIAAVSRFSLQTRQAGAELGTQIKITGGKDMEIDDAGCNLGTTIQVEDLFFNTPARKKFLKSTHTEASKINDFIIKLAISKPQIFFKLISKNKTVLATPGNGNMKETLQSIYGTALGEALLELLFEDVDIKLSGYVSKPSTIRSSRSWQTFIVNGRIISNRAIAKAIDNAYHALIPKTGYPLIAMNIEVPQHTIDVNVHPQKSEMKFADESRIFKAVYKAVLDAVHQTGVQKDLRKVAARPENMERHVQQGLLELRKSEPTYTPTYTFKPAEPMAWHEAAAEMQNARHKSAADEVKQGENSQKIIAQNYAVNNGQNTHENMEGNIPKNTGQNFRDSIRENICTNIEQSSHATVKSDERVNISEETSTSALKMTPLGQIDNTYIIASDAMNLYIVDQHAAHERILFDRFSGRADKIPKQQLLIHLMLDFSEHESQLLEENLAMLSELGFLLEPSGPKQFRLMEVPADVPSAEAEDFIREILASLEELHKPSAAELRMAAIATTACKAAVKAGFKMNLRQMELLLEELNSTDMPYTCPHGRPIILKFSSDELAKMFKRTGF